MVSQMTDIRKELGSRMAAIQEEIDKLKHERETIDAKLEYANTKLGALSRVYEIEAERLGEPNLPLFMKKGRGTPYRFAGMRLVDALAQLREERPGINKRQALEILRKEGFDFRGKRPLPAVHFAWVAIDRRKEKK